MVAEFLNATIIAPDERDNLLPSGQEIGPYKVLYGDVDGNYTKTDKNGKHIETNSDERGSWRVFKGGAEVDRYSGGWTPKSNPDFFDKLMYQQNFFEKLNP